MKTVASLFPAALALLLCLPAAAAPSRPFPHPVPGANVAAQSLAHDKSGLCLSSSDRGRGRGAGVLLEPCDGGLDQQWTVTRKNELLNVATQECLEPGEKRARGTVGLGDCGQKDQQWEFHERRGRMTLRNKKGNQCLDVTGGRGASPVMRKCDRDDEQFWGWVDAPRAPPAPRDFALQSPTAGTCLNVAGRPGPIGTNVIMSRCEPREDQRWVLNARGELVNVAYGQCLEGAGHATNAGRDLQLGECRAKNDQTWEEVRLGQALVLRNKAHGHCLDLNGGMPRLAACTGRPDQNWTRVGFEPPRPPAPPPPPPPPPAPIAAPALLINQAQGMCLDAEGFDGRQGANVKLDTCDARADQLWSFDPRGRVLNAAKGLCLDAAGNKGARGSKVALAACDGKPDQSWDAVMAGETFTLRNRASGQCLDVSGRAGNRGDNTLLYDCDNGRDQVWALTLPAAQQPPPVVVHQPPAHHPPPRRPPPAPSAMGEDLFAKVLDGMRRGTFSKDKVHAFEVGVDGYHLTCTQLVRALKLVTFANDKVKLVELAAPRVLDRENREDVVRAITFSSDQRTVRELLR